MTPGYCVGLDCFRFCTGLAWLPQHVLGSCLEGKESGGCSRVLSTHVAANQPCLFWCGLVLISKMVLDRVWLCYLEWSSYLIPCLGRIIYIYDSDIVHVLSHNMDACVWFVFIYLRIHIYIHIRVLFEWFFRDVWCRPNGYCKMSGFEPDFCGFDTYPDGTGLHRHQPQVHTDLVPT